MKAPMQLWRLGLLIAPHIYKYATASMSVDSRVYIAAVWMVLLGVLLVPDRKSNFKKISGKVELVGFVALVLSFMASTWVIHTYSEKGIGTLPSTLLALMGLCSAGIFMVGSIWGLYTASKESPPSQP